MGSALQMMYTINQKKKMKIEFDWLKTHFDHSTYPEFILTIQQVDVE